MNNGNRPAPQDLGPRERSMVEATLTLLQNAAAWPTFDELDKHADNHLGIADASEVLTGIPPTYLRGLHGLSSIPGDRKIELGTAAVVPHERWYLAPMASNSRKLSCTPSKVPPARSRTGSGPSLKSP